MDNLKPLFSARAQDVKRKLSNFRDFYFILEIVKAFKKFPECFPSFILPVFLQ